MSGSVVPPDTKRHEGVLVTEQEIHKRLAAYIEHEASGPVINVRLLLQDVIAVTKATDHDLDELLDRIEHFWDTVEVARTN